MCQGISGTPGGLFSKKIKLLLAYHCSQSRQKGSGVRLLHANLHGYGNKVDECYIKTQTPERKDALREMLMDLIYMS